MTALNASELHELLAVGQGAADCAGLAELRRETLRLLQRVFNAAAANFFLVLNREGGEPWRLDGGTGHDLDQVSFNRYHRTYYPLDPFIPALARTVDAGLCRALPTHRVVNYGAFEQSAFYNEFYRPQGLYWAMGLSLVHNRRPLGLVGLFRTRRGQPFSEEEVAKAELLGPCLSAALTRAMAADSVAERERLLEAVSPDLPYKGILLLDEELHPVYVNRTAGDVLRRIGDAGAVPERLLAEARALRAAQSRANPPVEARTAILFAHGTRRLDVYLRVLDIAGGGRRFLACLGPEPPRMAAAARMRDLGLTRRQIEVAHLVSFGLTNGQIADKLCISVETVHNHLRTIYDKLGVRNRTALTYQLAHHAGRADAPE